MYVAGAWGGRSGWTGHGTGLGARGSGIVEPISVGETRTKAEQFQGLGLASGSSAAAAEDDPSDRFAQFRRQQSQTYNSRFVGQPPRPPAPTS